VYMIGDAIADETFDCWVVFYHLFNDWWKRSADL